MTPKTLLTVEEFLALDLPEDRRYELDEGEIIESTYPSPSHNRTVARIFSLIRVWNIGTKAGEVFLPDTPYIVASGSLRGPDVSWIRQSRVDLIDPDKPIPGAPDLAVEVVSPSERRGALLRKVGQYLAAGSVEVWLVYTITHSVTVFSAVGERVLDSDDLIESPVLLPGFSARVSEFFADPEE
jgi:Uma2 family endonuclease